MLSVSYSQVWYQFSGAAEGYFASWETMLDWMALSGINLALAYTGQEEMYRKVYQGFGIDTDVFASWSNGPAHLAWSRGQSMHGVGGPLPTSWMTQQWQLQRQILERMRALGIVPVLPAFQGNVPPRPTRRRWPGGARPQPAGLRSIEVSLAARRQSLPSLATPRAHRAVSLAKTQH
jgi:alpha-N-acetylglucosaminidase